MNKISITDFAINAFISYSIVPIRFCTYTGITLSALSSFTAVGYALLKIFIPKIQPPASQQSLSWSSSFPAFSYSSWALSANTSAPFTRRCARSPLWS